MESNVTFGKKWTSLHSHSHFHYPSLTFVTQNETKGDKDAIRRGGSGRQEEWGEENGREKYILSIHNGIVSTTSFHV